MAKKEKIVLTRSEALQEIDSELEQAMDRLDGTNDRIDEMLANFDEDPEADGMPIEDASSDTAEQAAAPVSSDEESEDDEPSE